MVLNSSRAVSSLNLIRPLRDARWRVRLVSASEEEANVVLRVVSTMKGITRCCGMRREIGSRFGRFAFWAADHDIRRFSSLFWVTCICLRSTEQGKGHLHRFLSATYTLHNKKNPPPCAGDRLRSNTLPCGSLTSFFDLMSPAANDRRAIFFQFEALLRYQHDSNRNYRCETMSVHLDISWILCESIRISISCSNDCTVRRISSRRLRFGCETASFIVLHWLMIYRHSPGVDCIQMAVLPNA